jgi:hypothetical protein
MRSIKKMGTEAKKLNNTKARVINIRERKEIEKSRPMISHGINGELLIISLIGLISIAFYIIFNVILNYPSWASTLLGISVAALFFSSLIRNAMKDDPSSETSQKNTA